MSVEAIGWALRQRTGSSARKAVLLALANCHNNHTGECFPHIKTLAEEADVSYATAKRALDALVESGLIRRERRRADDGSLRGYDFVFPRLNVSHSDEPGLTVSPDPGRRVSPQEEPEVEDLEPEGPPVVPLPVVQARAQITGAWRLFAPPLIAHRDSYFTDRKTVAAINRALAVYAPEDVRAAVQNYAVVLGGDEFRWSYSWTLVDFLKRGLDRFVPEARPLENFRQNGGPAQKFGRRAVSSRELLDLADRLEGEDATG